MWRDSETELDFLDYGYLINSVTEIVENDDLLPACIGLYGDWGSGKSSVIHMSKSLLENNDKDIKCMIFNGWLFENYEDAKSALLGEILDAITDERKLSETAKSLVKGLWDSIDKLKLAKKVVGTGSDFLLTGGMATLTGLTVRNVMSAVSNNVDNIDDDTLSKIQQNVKDELNFTELRENIRSFQKNFAKILEESKISRLVVFVDELDRCRPDTILDTLEAIKLFLFTGKTAFVIGADERQIEYAVKSKFKDIPGQEISIGKEYMEKLIQYPIRIPRLDTLEVSSYISCLFLQKKLSQDNFRKFLEVFHTAQKDDFTNVDLNKILADLNLNESESIVSATQLAELMTQALNGNPRQYKRFLNMLDLRIQQAKYKGKELNQKILTKIMMLEYYRPIQFKKFAELSKTGDLKEKLKEGEENEGATQDGIEDEWLLRWYKTEPHIANEDLRLYFYFSRTSLEERVSILKATMSVSAQRVFDIVISEGEESVTKAEEEMKNLSIDDGKAVIEAFVNRIVSSEKVAIEQVKILTGLSLTKKELYEEGMIQLKLISASQLTAGAAPYIAEFAKQTHMKEELEKIMSNQWKDNTILVKTIRNSLGKER